MSNTGRVGQSGGDGSQRTETALVVFNPNQAQNHSAIMKEVQQKRSARVDDAQSLSKLGKVDIAARAKLLEPHVAKLAAERKELDKWNLNADGRNQGLVHIIDYAYAPPPKTQNAQLSELLAHRSMTGKALRREMGLDTSAFGELQKKDLMSGESEKQPMLTKAGRKLQQNYDDVVSRMSTMMGGALDKKAMAQTSEYKWLGEQKNYLTQDIRDETIYSLKPDDSKKGRLPLVAKSAGLPSFKTAATPHGSEIIGVTQELERLRGDKSLSKTTPEPSKGGTYTAKESWVKAPDKNPNGTTHWELQRNVTIPNTAVSEKVATDSNGAKLQVVRWGTAPGKEKFSTVMGGSGK
ncbi:MAG: hypothetical protein ACM31P_20265 [Actinomycetota bacterium]